MPDRREVGLADERSPGGKIVSIQTLDVHLQTGLRRPNQHRFPRNALKQNTEWRLHAEWDTDNHPRCRETMDTYNPVSTCASYPRRMNSETPYSILMKSRALASVHNCCEMSDTTPRHFSIGSASLTMYS